MERQESLLQAANAVMATMSKVTHETEIISGLVDFIHRHAGFSGAWGGLYNCECQTLYGIEMRGEQAECLPSQEKEFLLEPHAQKLGEVICQGECLLITDDEERTRVGDCLPFQVFSRKPGRCLLICPMKIDYRIMGILAVETRSKWRLEEHMALIQSLALHAGMAIDRFRAYDQLGKSNLHWKDCANERTRELQIANANLQELNRLKSKFVAMVSHELRTPLTAIHMLVDNLLEGITGRLEAKQKQYCTRIAGNVQRLQRLTADLLDLAQIESGHMKLSMERIDLVQLIEEVVDGLFPLADAKNVRISVTTSPTLPAVIGDRDRLFQVMNNLIHNAIKFSRQEGQVTISLEAMENHVVKICIADTGCGMAPHELENIFQPFYCIPSPHSFMKGVGLGLALTRELVVLHHGKIWADSHAGQGSRFHVSFPTHLSSNLYRENGSNAVAY